MTDTAISIDKRPTKPPLPNPMNVLTSIPNSTQLATIANAALQNIISIPSTPPPPPVHLLQSQSNQFMTNSVGNGCNGNMNNKLPPGLPIPMPLPSISPFGNVSSSPIPIISSTSPTPPNYTNIGGGTTKRNKKRKRSKRATKNNKNNNNKKTKQDMDGDGDGESINGRYCNSEDLEQETIQITKRNLINAIELERRNHELTKIRLVQLHKHYGNMLTNLKTESKYLTNKINILKNGPSQNDLEVILKQKQDLRNEYLRKRSIRIKDEQQLKQTNKENQKLVIIIHYLKQQLDALLTQYQSLCAKQSDMNNKNTKCSDAQIIVNNLDSLDIVDAESMVNHSKLSPSSSNVVSQRINDDPWFQKIMEENRMLERHIRFLRHIIERETQRCNFKEIIIGKKLLSPSPKKGNNKIKETVNTES